MQGEDAQARSVRDYHARTKHHFNRYAAGPGGLDWATQPDPFRIFDGSVRTDLPLAADGLIPSYADLYLPDAIPAQPLTLANLSALLELSFGLSAWKQYGSSRWALRCNPSSGNLHPTEAYAVVTGCAGLADGVHHYASRDHALEQRCAFDRSDALPQGGFLLGLSSIHWREAWKYGERAYRYCQHDAGHAIAAVSYAAAAIGWQVQLLSDWSDAEAAALLGLDRDADFRGAEREHPDLVLFLARTPDCTPPDAHELVAAAQRGSWTGHANALSPHHAHDWPIIDDVAHAAAKPRTSSAPPGLAQFPPPLPTTCTLGAAHLIRQRRSAQALDGVSSIPAQTFFRMLDMTLPRPDLPPWNALPWPSHIHLVLFVHRVDDLEPGLYLFLRQPDASAHIRPLLSPDFEWTPVANAPPHFPLWRLAQGDARPAARTLSCHQDIAADGAFSLGMLAEYDRALEAGPWMYQRLFWEAGMVGQVLYLESEAAGVRGTGIGCYFDDPVHEVLGLHGTALQSLYHFTVGTALEDLRLQTIPPYAHLARI